jgi:hypothetical protein
VFHKHGACYHAHFLRLRPFLFLFAFRYYGINLISGYEFCKARDVLKYKQKDLKKKGKGNLPKRAEPLTDTWFVFFSILLAYTNKNFT